MMGYRNGRQSCGLPARWLLSLRGVVQDGELGVWCYGLEQQPDVGRVADVGASPLRQHHLADLWHACVASPVHEVTDHGRNEA